MTDVTAPMRLVSWNAVSLHLPASWQMIVSDKQHLIFEEQFEAVFEVKWQQTASHGHAQKLIKSSVKQWQELSGEQLEKCALKNTPKQLFHQYSAVSYTTGNGAPSVVFLYCSHCKLFLMLHFFSSQNDNHPITYLESITCHREFEETQLWALQDFKLQLPKHYSYCGHSMQAGLTTLHFSHGRTSLHTCRMAPAAVRLQKSTLADILQSLLAEDLSSVDSLETENQLSCWRQPSILRQVIIRLQRKKPFFRAFLRHDLANDRLLGVIMESVHPISEDDFSVIDRGYEIVSQ